MRWSQILVITFMCVSCSTPAKQNLKSSYYRLISTDGSVIAHCLKFYGDGGGTTFLENEY